MIYTKELLFGLTIGLIVGTVLITLAVAILACSLCKLRKRVEAELKDIDRVKRVHSASNRPMNKYTPSVRQTCSGDPECYESRPLGMEQSKQGVTTRDDDDQKDPRDHQAESIEMQTRNNSDDSYIEMLNDGQTQGDEEVYLEPRDNVTSASTVHERIISEPEVRPKPTSQNQAKAEKYSKPNGKNPQNPQSFNQKNSSMTSKQSSTHDRRHGCRTADQLVEDDCYIAIQPTEPEDFYGNQEMFTSLNEKGIPTDEGEIYGNEEAIARHKTDRYNVNGDEEFYVNDHNSQVTEVPQYLQIRADYNELDEIYLNQYRSSNT